MFSVDDRNRVRDHVLDRAKADSRVVAGAVIGSLATSEGDRWSDLDLTFGVADGVALSEVLDDFTIDLGREFNATHLFDLPSGAAIYRVFLLQGCLQFDLSFAPASQWGALGPEFRLLFGHAAQLARRPASACAAAPGLCRPPCAQGSVLASNAVALGKRSTGSAPSGLRPQPGVPSSRTAGTLRAGDRRASRRCAEDRPRSPCRPPWTARNFNGR